MSTEVEKSKDLSETNGDVTIVKWISELQSTTEKDGTTQKNTGKISTESKMIPPDGGWGWMIIVGGFFTMVVGSLPLFGFSILFSPLLMSFSVSSLKIAWIMNIHGLLWNVTALFVGPLSEEFGWRKVAITGGILNFFSVVFSALAPQPEFLFFSFSVLGGIGASTGITIYFIVVSRYFLKYRGFALAVTTLGFCLGAFISPIICNYLLENYGYVGASLIVSAVVLNQCVGGALLQPVEWHMKSVESDTESEKSDDELLNEFSEPADDLKYNEKRFKPALQFERQHNIRLQGGRRLSAFSVHSAVSLGHSIIDLSAKPPSVKPHHECKEYEQESNKSNNMFHVLKRITKSTLENLRTLKYMRVKIICLGSSCLVLGYINFQMWIPFVITNAGYPLEMAAWCVSAGSIANIVMRIIISFVSDWRRFNVRYGYTFAMLLLATAIIAFSLVKNIKLYAICVCIWGLGIGLAYSLNPTVQIEVMGVEKFPAVFGVSSLFIGLFSIGVGPLVGLIRDATGSYTYALWLLGGAELLGFLLWLLMPLAVKYDQKKHAEKYLNQIS